MSDNWGKCDFKELRRLQDEIKKTNSKKFCEVLAKELAARLLAKVVKKTPVGNYKYGGTLRKNWTAGENVKIIEKEGIYELEIINNTEYASYVEYGHRTRNGQGWLKGRFMMTISENELKEEAPSLIEAKIKKYLERGFKC